MPYRSLIIVAAILSLQAYAQEQWSNSPTRNGVLPAKNLPTAIDKNTRVWEQRLDNYHYATPTVIGDLIIVGSTQEAARGDRLKRKRDKTMTGFGAILAFDRHTGKLRWQLATRTAVFPKPMNSWWFGWYGVCAAAVGEGDKIYAVGSSGDVLCLDPKGLSNGNDGPFQGELDYLKPHASKPLGKLADTDADILWRYDMAVEHKVPLHDAVSGTPLIIGDQLWVPTCKGFGKKAKRGQHPSLLLKADGIELLRQAPDWEVPNMIVLDKNSGKLLACDKVEVPLVNHGQWSSPALWSNGDTRLVLYPDGYGYLHAYRIPETGEEPVILQTAWSLDCTPKHYRVDENGKERKYEVGKEAKAKGIDKATIPAPSEIIATPVIADGLVYVALGRDQNHGPAKGALSCLNPAKLDENGKPTLVWRFEDMCTTMASPTVYDGICYVADTRGRLYALDAATGELIWKEELKGGHLYAAPLLADGKLYLNANRYLWVLKPGRKFEVLGKAKFGGQAVTPTAVDGMFYEVARGRIGAYRGEEEEVTSGK